MKKILLVSLMFLGVNLMASCPNWFGDSDYQQPPKPYCFNIELTRFWTGNLNTSGQYLVAQEDVSDKSVTSYDYSGLDFLGDGRVGFYVYVSQWGYGSSTNPNLKMNYISADLLGSSTFYNAANIVLGYVYLFYVTQKTQDIHGDLYLYDYLNFRDGIYIH
jgi:hypothetical protein